MKSCWHSITKNGTNDACAVAPLRVLVSLSVLFPSHAARTTRTRANFCFTKKKQKTFFTERARAYVLHPPVGKKGGFKVAVLRTKFCGRSRTRYDVTECYCTWPRWFLASDRAHILRVWKPRYRSLSRSEQYVIPLISLSFLPNFQYLFAFLYLFFFCFCLSFLLGSSLFLSFVGVLGASVASVYLYRMLYRSFRWVLSLPMAPERLPPEIARANMDSFLSYEADSIDISNPSELSDYSDPSHISHGQFYVALAACIHRGVYDCRRMAS